MKNSSKYIKRLLSFVVSVCLIVTMVSLENVFSIKANTVVENTFSNSCKLLNYENKLTIGYIGGSITYGVSAIEDGGSIELSYVNRISNWFKKQYPKAEIETVNAGVSDTATNFGLFRLEKTLMNTNGHDMPDLVFVEFTVNDITYETQTKDDLKRQIESVFLNIWKHNPYAEIGVIISATSENTSPRKAYIEVAEHYNIPYVDVGLPMQAAKIERGYPSESSGNYYYTVDNLHPSWRGYEIYFNEIENNLLKKYFVDINLQNDNLYNYYQNLPKQQNKFLIDNPQIITADSLRYGTGAQKIDSSLKCNMYGTNLTASKVSIVNDYLEINSQATISTEFYGTSLGIMFMMNKTGIKMTYRIDGGVQKQFSIDKNNLSWQMYSHLQAFMLAHNLSEGMHTVEFTFSIADGYDSMNVQLAGVLANDYNKINVSKDIINGSVFVERELCGEYDRIIVTAIPEEGKQLKADGLKYNISDKTYPIVKRVDAANSDGSFNKKSESQCNSFEFNLANDASNVIISSEFVDKSAENIAVIGTSINQSNYKLRFRSRAYRTFVENGVEYTLKQCGTLLFKEPQQDIELSHKKILNNEIIGKVVPIEKLYDRTDDYYEYVCNINYGSENSEFLDDNYYAYAYAVYINKEGKVKTIYSENQVFNNYNDVLAQIKTIL